jgi:hypothetical protein
MSETPMPKPPREPEIEFMGKVARRVILLLRVAFFSAGALAIGHGLQEMAATGSADSLPPMQAHNDRGVVWIALGLPLVVPSRWILSKTRALKAMLAVFALLWFVPVCFENDSPYGYILRMFATLISFLSMLVWRTLWRLTQPDDAAS